MDDKKEISPPAEPSYEEDMGSQTAVDISIQGSNSFSPPIKSRPLREEKPKEDEEESLEELLRKKKSLVNRLGLNKIFGNK